MNLEQSEASINEAVSSRKQTQETIEQGRTLMVFTVITIIFVSWATFFEKASSLMTYHLACQ